jgi:hypothetical protein
MTPATCSEVTPMNGGSLVCAVDVAAMTSAGPAIDSAPTMVGVGALIAIGVAARMARARPKARLLLPVAAPAPRLAAGAGAYQLDLAQTIALAVLAAAIVGVVIGVEWHMLHEI